jgi:ubiquinone/menaquinone biosynthesis C-methylase UbiE
MAGRICPWWVGYFIANPVRRLWQDPQAILRPFIAEGMQVLEPGCGMGFFTIEIARLVGPRGKVVAVDLQPKMIAGLKRRARRAAVDGRIDARLARETMLNVDDLAGGIDFVLAFALVHELPDKSRFFAELYRALRQGRKLLLAEPKGHVTETQFEATMESAKCAGFRLVDRPVIRWSRTAVFDRA